MRRDLAAIVMFIATAAAALGLSGCQSGAVAGHRCGPEGDYGVGIGRDGQNTYRCVGGRWRYDMPTAEAARLLKAAQDAATSTSSTAPPTSTSTTTTSESTTSSTTTSSSIAPCDSAATGC